MTVGDIGFVVVLRSEPWSQEHVLSISSSSSSPQLKFAAALIVPLLHVTADYYAFLKLQYYFRSLIFVFFSEYFYKLLNI